MIQENGHSIEGSNGASNLSLKKLVERNSPIPYKEQQAAIKNFKSLPPPLQKEKALESFSDCDSELREKVSDAVVKVANIHAFVPKIPIDYDQIGELSNLSQREFGRPEYPLVIIENDWDLALHSAREDARGYLDMCSRMPKNVVDDTIAYYQEKRKEAPFSMDWELSIDSARRDLVYGNHDPKALLAHNIVTALTYPLANDIYSQFPNEKSFALLHAPDDFLHAAALDVMRIFKEDQDFEQQSQDKRGKSIIDLYALGLWPIGQTQDERFVVFVPPTSRT